MGLNIFAAGRRIAAVAALLLSVIVGWSLWTEAPAIPLRYGVVPDFEHPPETAFVPATNGCIDGLTRYAHRQSAEGRPVTVMLCFPQIRLETGQQGVLFRTAANEWRIGPEGSSEVTHFADATANTFQLPPPEAEKADRLLADARAKAWKAHGQFLLFGWLVLWLSSLVIGWVLRGLFNIPRGMDFRPSY